ncbi:hypothetical protein ACJJIE_13285 [Microbulbifer sp. TRSA001]|uniref:hypothetical protein n=1 Tax=Microbulbifer sp. TRSA001 TaxID=3243381 RepID=UPI00403A2E41
MTSNSSTQNTRHRAKTISLFFGQSLLFFLGLISLIYIFVEFFEGNFSFSELSTQEMLFGFLLFSLINYHLTASKEAGLKWTSILYRPLRNIGWYTLIGSLFFLSIPFLALLITKNSIDVDEFILLIGKYDSYLQLMDLIIVLICFYWAIPKTSSIPKQATGEDTATEGLAR